MTTTTTIINFYLEYDDEAILEPVVLKWDKVDHYLWSGDEETGTCEVNPEYVDNNPMRKFYVEKYKRMPEYDKEYGRAFWMDGYRLPKSKGWSLVGSSNRDAYSFSFANRKDAEKAKKELEAAE
jgi:hypothetical protein